MRLQLERWRLRLELLQAVPSSAVHVDLISRIVARRVRDRYAGRKWRRSPPAPVSRPQAATQPDQAAQPKQEPLTACQPGPQLQQARVRVGWPQQKPAGALSKEPILANGTQPAAENGRHAGRGSSQTVGYCGEAAQWPCRSA